MCRDGGLEAAGEIRVIGADQIDSFFGSQNTATDKSAADTAVRVAAHGGHGLRPVTDRFAPDLEAQAIGQGALQRGLDAGLVGPRLRLEYRKGGEKIRVDGQSHTSKLKKLLQEEGIVPWMRDRVPLVYSGDTLVAVGDLFIAAEAASSPGVAIRWEDRPALH